jgi:hypothetical protein
MELSVKIIPFLRRLLITAGILLPGLAMAHGSDHLHFWGQHSADVQFILLSLSMLALFGIGWWLWRSRGQ